MIDIPLITEEQLPWDLVKKDGGHLDVRAMAQTGSKRWESGGIHVVKTVFSGVDGLKKAERFHIRAGANTHFFCDRIICEAPVNVRSRFQISHADKALSCNIADKNKLVLRENGRGVKLFRLMYRLDGEDILATAGLLMPDGFYPNGDMRLTYYSGLYHFAQSHTVLYGVCADTAEQIGKWHFKERDGFIAEPPNKQGGYRATVTDADICVENTEDENERVTIRLIRV